MHATDLTANRYSVIPSMALRKNNADTTKLTTLRAVRPSDFIRNTGKKLSNAGSFDSFSL